MAVTILTNRKEPGRIGSLVLDAILSDSHEYSNDITNYPIEEGSDISDHIKRTPVSVSITGIITNSPLETLVALKESTIRSIADGYTTTLKEKSFDRVTGGFIELLSIMGENNSTTINVRKPKLVELVTGLKVYQNMAMIKLSITRTPDIGEAIKFTATFKPIKKISRQSTIIPKISDKSGSGSNTSLQDQISDKENAGNQQPKQLKSVAKRLVESDLPGKVVDTVKDLVGIQ